MVVFVEAAVLEDTLLAEYGDFSSVKERLMTFRAGTDDLTDKIDFIICLGGDGTLLHASSLFQVRLVLLHSNSLFTSGGHHLASGIQSVMWNGSIY